MVTVTKSEDITLVAMLDPLWTHLSDRVEGSMIAFNELAQTNTQISEHDQVPWSAGRNKRTSNLENKVCVCVINIFQVLMRVP